MSWNIFRKKKHKSGGNNVSSKEQERLHKKDLEYKSNQIERDLEYNQKIHDRTISFLLIGPGGSGKSTVIKQMEKIYNGSIPKHILIETGHYIQRKNIVQDAYEIAKQNIKLKATFPECHMKSDTSERVALDLISIVDRELDMNQRSLTPEIVSHIKLLWADDGFRETFNIRKKSHIMDNTPYFFNNIERIAHPDYIATFEDYIRVRNRTTGINESYFDILMDNKQTHKSNVNDCKTKLSSMDIEKMWRFKFTDVGGQRMERKKLNNMHVIFYTKTFDP